MTLSERFHAAADKAAFRRNLTPEQADLLTAELALDHEPEATRGPDIVKDVESWIDPEPMPSAMKSTRTGEAKLTRRARVRNKSNQLVEITVVTTAKGWASASSEKVEGYLSQDRSKVYWQHHMVSAHSNADQFV